jgi:hypothetical protein
LVQTTPTSHARLPHWNWFGPGFVVATHVDSAEYPPHESSLHGIGVPPWAVQSEAQDLQQSSASLANPQVLPTRLPPSVVPLLDVEELALLVVDELAALAIEPPAPPLELVPFAPPVPWVPALRESQPTIAQSAPASTNSFNIMAPHGSTTRATRATRGS